MRSKEDFFSEFYYPDEMVTENEGTVEVLSILRALHNYLKPYNKQLKPLVCSSFTV